MKKKISIVTPTYNEHDNMKKLCEEISKELSQTNYDYEHIVIDNSSEDDTIQILKDLANIFEKKNIKEIDKTSDLENFDSLIILQIINLAKIRYKKQIDGRKIANCKKISDIIALFI